MPPEAEGSGHGTGGAQAGTGGRTGIGGAQAGTGGAQAGTGGSLAGTGGSSNGSGGADGGSSLRFCLAYSDYPTSWTACSQTASDGGTLYGYLDNYSCATCVGHDTTLPDCFPENIPTLCVASCQECAFQ